MTEGEHRARVAICKCLEDGGGFMSQETIDRIVFYGFADVEMLRQELRAMTHEGLIQRVSNGCYKLDDQGRAFLDRESPT